ncbi:hypothetical protein KEM52_000067 [Ascosphaera acerosa]|nr:hypothetical protein KEM52_000067 [Ascosphaera acerosa]
MQRHVTFQSLRKKDDGPRANPTAEYEQPMRPIRRDTAASEWDHDVHGTPCETLDPEKFNPSASADIMIALDRHAHARTREQACPRSQMEHMAVTPPGPLQSQDQSTSNQTPPSRPQEALLSGDNNTTTGQASTPADDIHSQSSMSAIPNVPFESPRSPPLPPVDTRQRDITPRTPCQQPPFQRNNSAADGRSEAHNYATPWRPQFDYTMLNVVSPATPADEMYARIKQMQRQLDLQQHQLNQLRATESDLSPVSSEARDGSPGKDARRPPSPPMPTRRLLDGGTTHEQKAELPSRHGTGPSRLRSLSPSRIRRRRQQAAAKENQSSSAVSAAKLPGKPTESELSIDASLANNGSNAVHADGSMGGVQSAVEPLATSAQPPVPQFMFDQITQCELIGEHVRVFRFHGETAKNKSHVANTLDSWKRLAEETQARIYFFQDSSIRKHLNIAIAVLEMLGASPQVFLSFQRMQMGALEIMAKAQETRVAQAAEGYLGPDYIDLEDCHGEGP